MRVVNFKRIAQRYVSLKVVVARVQGTWEEAPKAKESAYFPGMLRNGGLALKTQGIIKGTVSTEEIMYLLL